MKIDLSMNTDIETGVGILLIHTAYHENHQAKAVPGATFNRKTKTWEAPITKACAKYLLGNAFIISLSPEVKSALEWEMTRTNHKDPFPEDYTFLTKPDSYQLRALNDLWSLPNSALLAWMGVGKTKIAIDLFSARVPLGMVGNLLVICPTSIKRTWYRELETHCPLLDYHIHILESGNRRATEKFIFEQMSAPKILIVGVEALSQGQAEALTEMFLIRNNPVMCVLDESSRIKNHKAIRTERVIELGSLCKYKIIMTGTSITQGIQDLYSQFRFLDWTIIGHKSFYTFRNRYCIMGGFENRSIVGYNNVSELMDLVRPYVHHIPKSVLGLPEKTYETRFLPPTTEQKRLMRELKDEMTTEHAGHTITVEGALDMLTRFQQITGGFIPGGDGTVPVKGKNPKMEELLSVLEEMPSDIKIIIWARFVAEVETIAATLAKEYGPHSVLTFYGKTENRGEIEPRFQNDSNVRFLVANRTASMGLTLTAATAVIYFSNSFSYEDRVQSEDRCHRRGQDKSVHYIDLFLDVKCEHLMLKALKYKSDLASMVVGSLSTIIEEM